MLRVHFAASAVLLLLLLLAAGCGASAVATDSVVDRGEITSTDPVSTPTAGSSAGESVDVPGDGPTRATTPMPSGPARTFTVAGDSISVGLGRQLVGLVGGGVTVDVIGVQGTGLAFPNGYDWPARAEEIAEGNPPDVFVFSVGTNDFVDLLDDSGAVVARWGEPGWSVAYAARLARVFDAFSDTGTQVWWVGHVCVERAVICETNREIHALAVALGRDRPWVRIADLGELLGFGDEPATGCLAADGIHLDAECLHDAAAELLAPAVPAVR
ncbi:MAG: hypothetical protein RIE08_01175 [Acidimicrobiales bacterium]